MYRATLGMCVIFGLAACEPLPEGGVSSERIALAGPELEARLSGKTLVMTELTDNPFGPITATVELRPNGTAILTTDFFTDRTGWRIVGQDLCFTTVGSIMQSSDCRTIGWIEGNRFAVFDRRENPPLKIADGIIQDS